MSYNDPILYGDKQKNLGLKRSQAENPINTKKGPKTSKKDFEMTVIDRLDRIELVLNELLASIVHSDHEEEISTQCLD